MERLLQHPVPLVPLLLLAVLVHLHQERLVHLRRLLEDSLALRQLRLPLGLQHQVLLVLQLQVACLGLQLQVALVPLLLLVALVLRPPLHMVHRLRGEAMALEQRLLQLMVDMAPRNKSELHK